MKMWVNGHRQRRGLATFLPCLVVFLVLFFNDSPLVAADQDALGKTVAKVNGIAIRQWELNDATAALIPQASYHRNVSPEKMKELRRQALDTLIREELFYRAALKKGYRVSKDDLNKRWGAIAGRYPSKSAFREALKTAGLKEEDLRKKIEHMMTADLFVKEEVIKKAEISDAGLLDYYKKNQEKFQKPEARRLSHILIRVPPEAAPGDKEKLKKKAEEILQKIRKGGDFQQIAWDNSDDPSRVKGGDLGEVHRGRLDPDVEAAAFALKKGEISGVVSSLYGYHIIKVADAYPPRQLTFEEARDKLKKELEEKEVAKRRADLIKTLKDAAKIETFID